MDCFTALAKANPEFSHSLGRKQTLVFSDLVHF